MTAPTSTTPTSATPTTTTPTSTAPTSAAPTSRWLISPPPGPYAEMRLFCFPYAGGSASAYNRWLRLSPSRILISGVEYPGRGIRFGESAHLRMAAMVTDLADRIEAMPASRFAFFGHSMGGLVAYHVARELRDRGARLPEHLFISATAAPEGNRTRNVLHDATDEEVLEELRTLGGTPPELLADRDLMALTIATMKADYTLLGDYEYREGAPLDIPFSIFAGRADEVCRPEQVRGWSAHTSAGSRLKIFPGDHFFLHSAAEEVLRTVNATLFPTTRLTTA